MGNERARELHEATLSLPGGSVEELLPLVYQELRGIARRERRHLSGGETLATTALISEAYLRLANNPAFATRGDFLRIAAVAIRRILIDRVRVQLSAKRNHGLATVELDEAAEFHVDDDEYVLKVHDALAALGQLNPLLVQVVECRFFAGYSEVETAEALQLSERSVQRYWSTARAWLKRELAG